MNDIISTISDEEKDALIAAVSYLIVSVGNRRVVRKALVSFGLPEDQAKRVYSLTAALAFVIGSNFAAGKRFSDRFAPKATLS